MMCETSSFHETKHCQGSFHLTPLAMENTTGSPLLVLPCLKEADDFPGENMTSIMRIYVIGSGLRAPYSSYTSAALFHYLDYLILALCGCR